MYIPRALNEPVVPAVAALAAMAVNGRLVVCAGAGLSKGSPTGLPLGAELAQIVFDSLAARIGAVAMEDAAPADLLSVADVVEELPGGVDLLQTALSSAADFTTAEPNYGHHALALLILEGAVECIVTNYDDCVERGCAPCGRLQAIITETDRATVIGAAVLKAHGCATRAGSLRASSSQLATPPTWVLHHFGDRLGDSVVVFVGLGDVANYVRIRIQQLLDAIGDHQVWVAATSLSAAWQELVPGVDARFIEARADDFLDQLLRDYVRIALEELRERSAEHDRQGTYTATGLEICSGTEMLIDALTSRDALSVLLWLRQSAHRWPAGESVLHAPAGRSVLLALAIAASRRAPALDGARIRFAGEPVEVVLVRGGPASVAVEEAVRRIAAALNNGHVRMGDTVTVLCQGHEGPLPEGRLDNVIPMGGHADIIDGQMTPSLRFVSVQRMIEGELPEEWAA